MALTKSIPDPQDPGQVIAAAYARYSFFAIDVDARKVILHVKTYRSRTARESADGGGPTYSPVRLDIYVTDDSGAVGPDGPIPGAPNFGAYQSGDNSDPQGIGALIYGFLKTFTGWAGAEDA